MIIRKPNERDFYHKRKHTIKKRFIIIGCFIVVVLLGSSLCCVRIIQKKLVTATLSAAEREVQNGTGKENLTKTIGITTNDQMKPEQDGSVKEQDSQNNQDAQDNQVGQGDQELIEPDKESDTSSSADKSSTVTAEYDYKNAVPKSDAVDVKYFEDAVFIGDSRVEGFMLYSGIRNATAYTERGLMVDTIFTKPAVRIGEEKITIIDALKKEPDYTKIYLMFGINELGWISNDTFIAKYGLLVDKIKEMYPTAQVYIQSILPVSKDKVVSNVKQSNKKIVAYNKLIKEMSKEKQVYYVDLYSDMVDSQGSLPADATFDGVHLMKPYCEKWLTYLKTHTVTTD